MERPGTLLKLLNTVTRNKLLQACWLVNCSGPLLYPVGKYLRAHALYSKLHPSTAPQCGLATLVSPALVLGLMPALIFWSEILQSPMAVYNQSQIFCVSNSSLSGGPSISNKLDIEGKRRENKSERTHTLDIQKEEGKIGKEGSRGVAAREAGCLQWLRVMKTVGEDF